MLLVMGVDGCRVRTMTDETGHEVKEALPGTAVRISGEEGEEGARATDTACRMEGHTAVTWRRRAGGERHQQVGEGREREMT